MTTSRPGGEEKSGWNSWDQPSATEILKGLNIRHAKYTRQPGGIKLVDEVVGQCNWAPPPQGIMRDILPHLDSQYGRLHLKPYGNYAVCSKICGA